MKSIGEISIDRKIDGVVIGIDQSLTGFALVTINLSSGIVEASERTFKPGPNRLREIYEHVSALVGCRVVQAVAMEGYSFASADRAHVLGGVGGVTKLAIRDSGHEPFLIPPSTLKKFISGEGNADKKLIPMFVLKNFGIETRSNNVADAVGIAAMMAGKVGAITLPKWRIECLGKAVTEAANAEATTKRRADKRAKKKAKAEREAA